MSTLKADAITSASSNTDVVITGAGSGVPDIEASFKVGGTAGVPMASIRTSSGTASGSTFLRGDGTWQAPGGGAWSVITHTVASSASTISFTGFNSSTYGAYQVFWRYTPGTDNSRLYMRTSSNGGSSYDSGGSDYRYAGTTANDSNATGTEYSAGNDHITLQGVNGGNASGEHNMGYLFIVNPDAAVNCYINIFNANQWDDVKMAYFAGAAMRASAADVDAIQLYPNNGTATGEFTFLGMKKA